MSKRTKKNEAVIEDVEKAVENENSPEVHIYYGPTIRKVGLRQFAVYRGDLPKNIKKLFENEPILKALFIKPVELPRVRHNLKIPGTREHQLYLNVLESMEGGK